MDIEELHIGENKLPDFVMKDKDGNDFDISSLSFLEVKLYQYTHEVESYNLFPDLDPELTYNGSVLTLEITKTLSATLKPGPLSVRITTNNPNILFTDGGQHVNIEPVTIYKVVK